MIAELEKLYGEAKSRVKVACDEMHPHTAIRGCLAGDKDAITICKFAERLRELESAIDEFMGRVQ